MLLMKDLVEGIDEKYIPMLKQVSICDFTKCIAQFSGLHINNIPDNVIKTYLHTWARNKYTFYKIMKGKLRVDTPISYDNIREDIRNEVDELCNEYPAYAPWLCNFKDLKDNKIRSEYDLGFDARDWVRKYFPTLNIGGTTMTHFFKRNLNAPEELVTAIGRIFENEKIEATHTVSIDPVDMMLASENPYGWNSCYRLATDNSSSHADGCLAAILDDSSLITYVWNREGKFSLYNEYDFKSIRYKRMRQWISIAPELTAVHFNAIYPGKGDYPEEFRKTLRDVVETMLSQYLHKTNVWVRDDDCRCDRGYGYGYSEYDCDNIWKLKETDTVEWEVFNCAITCPCGCGSILPGSYDTEYEEENEEYNGDGFICENYITRHWCDLCDDWCTCADDMCEDNCRGCNCWDNTYPYCDLGDERHICEDPDYQYTDYGVMSSCEGHCSECPFWALHHPEEAAAATATEQVEEQKNNTVTLTVNPRDGYITFPELPTLEDISPSFQGLVYGVRDDQTDVVTWFNER